MIEGRAAKAKNNNSQAITTINCTARSVGAGSGARRHETDGMPPGGLALPGEYHDPTICNDFNIYNEILPQALKDYFPNRCGAGEGRSGHWRISQIDTHFLRVCFQCTNQSLFHAAFGGHPGAIQRFSVYPGVYTMYVCMDGCRYVGKLLLRFESHHVATVCMLLVIIDWRQTHTYM